MAAYMHALLGCRPGYHFYHSDYIHNSIGQVTLSISKIWLLWKHQL